MERIDVAVIGAGVTGLASALAIAARGLSTCVLERHPRPGLDTSTHNSGVIHAGIYYPAGTLKAALCLDGRRRLYEFCAAHGVPHARTGKIIVAIEPQEIAALEALLARGRANGVEGLALVDSAFVAAREPHVRAVSGPVLTRERDRRCRGAGEGAARLRRTAGAMFLPGTRLLGADSRPTAIEIHTERETIRAGQVVNAAGLHADEVSRMLGGESFTIYPCRGEYAEFTPASRHLVNSLVYPLPHSCMASACTS